MEHLKTFENFDKQFDKNVKISTLVKYVQEELQILKEKGEEPSFGGFDFEYWKQYDEEGNDLYNEDYDIEPTERAELHSSIKNIIKKYRTQNGENLKGEPPANLIELWILMLAVAEHGFNVEGKINTGVLGAVCMQNYDDIIPWKFSKKLVDLNNKTGIFED